MMCLIINEGILLARMIWLSCPAAEMVDGSKVLYYEQAFWRTPHKPFRQTFFMVKPCPKEMKCDVELSTYAIRDAEEYKNYCDRPKDQRPQSEEVIGYPDVGGGACCTICNTDLFHLAATSSMSNIWGHVIFLYFTHMMTLRGGSMVTAFNPFINRRNIGACVTDQS